MSIYDASREYIAEGTPLIILGGKEYGSGSSRDWAAKGTALLGVRAVLTESFERIHRSNLIGMGVLPLQFQPGESAETLGLTGTETFSITGIEELNSGNTPARGHGHRGRQDFPGGRPDRHSRRGRLLPARRHHAVRAPLSAFAWGDKHQSPQTPLPARVPRRTMRLRRVGSLRCASGTPRARLIRARCSLAGSLRRAVPPAVAAWPFPVLAGGLLRRAVPPAVRPPRPTRCSLAGSLRRAVAGRHRAGRSGTIATAALAFQALVREFSQSQIVNVRPGQSVVSQVAAH